MASSDSMKILLRDDVHQRPATSLNRTTTHTQPRRRPMTSHHCSKGIKM